MNPPNEAITLLKIITSVLTSLTFIFFITSKIPKGTPSLIAHLPFITLFFILPLPLSSSLLTGLTSFFITWLCTFKLILFSFDLGPLSNPNIKSSLTKFILFASFPIKIKHYPSHNSPRVAKPREGFENRLGFGSWVLGAKIIAFYLILYGCDHWRYRAPEVIIQCVYCVLLYLCLDHGLLVIKSVIENLTDVELQEPFDEPYKATSLQDFWGRRWNLMVSDALRHTVHEPVMWALKGRRWARFAGVTCSFVVSGLMHELIMWYLTRVRPTWEITWFFVIHGVCVGLEVGLGRSELGRRWRVHWAVRWGLSMGFLVGTGLWLFYPQFVRNKVDVRVIEEFKSFVGFLIGFVSVGSS